MQEVNFNREKEIELLVEKKRLEEVINTINEEILNYISKRKHITDYIVNYRKKVLEDYRDDEDKLVEYFDHERYVKEEAFKTIDKRLKELTILKESPYFGKITFKEKGELAENLYIGRFGLTPEESFEPVVVDWRAPVASLFYHGGLGDATYESPRGPIDTEILSRRQLIVKKGSLQGMFDSAIDVKDEILQMVLSSNSGEKLKDVIMTIQSEQDEIIRSSRDKTVVVNGVAGSGKTTIALHRVAYLLYNFRKQLHDKVLILGPNSIFMEYISQVLPSLGEVGVRQQTFTNFVLNEIDIDDEIMDFSNYIERILSGDEEFIKEAKYKNSENFFKKLSDYIKGIEENYFEVNPVTYFGEEIIGVDEIKELFNKHYIYMPLFRRSQKIKRVIISKIKDKRDEKVWELNKEIEEYKKSLTSDELIMEHTNIEFKRRIRIREIVREVMNSRAALEEWIDNEPTISLYHKFNGYKKLTGDDLAPILYMMIKLEGKKTKIDIKHIVIDEAQDYSALQFQVIRDLTGCRNFTIVGDVNQRLVKHSEVAPMLEINKNFEDIEVEHFDLTNSYRSTMEIMKYANNFLKEERIVPLVRHGEAVESIEFSIEEDMIDEILKSVEYYRDADIESIAIITKNVEELNRIYPKLREHIPLIKFHREDIIYKSGIVIIPSYFAKGLEFDGVIIVDYNENKDEEDLIKYIMCTRALHRLKDFKLKK
ncbi:DNA helicase [Clostridium polyendosporum]|uniref:DNA helicase n=1 Tax=Clostridium polyendosporum TaxID=69208 RepID=A0A919VLP1_9CLOT|nr:UvrD-helicase domain-containing protein [Clostridium polyendosporum]GIM28788.1 DNA helicase [Clostridium polyendosporum]